MSECQNSSFDGISAADVAREIGVDFGRERRGAG